LWSGIEWRRRPGSVIAEKLAPRPEDWRTRLVAAEMKSHESVRRFAEEDGVLLSAYLRAVIRSGRKAQKFVGWQPEEAPGCRCHAKDCSMDVCVAVLGDVRPSSPRAGRSFFGQSEAGVFARSGNALSA